MDRGHKGKQPGICEKQTNEKTTLLKCTTFA